MLLIVKMLPFRRYWVNPLASVYKAKNMKIILESKAIYRLNRKLSQGLSKIACRATGVTSLSLAFGLTLHRTGYLGVIYDGDL